MFTIANRVLAGALPLIGAGVLAGCAALQDAPRLRYQCPQSLPFEARLYQDMALLEGLRGHAVLERRPDAADARDAADAPEGAAPRYADRTVRAQFGLGLGGRLVRLDYTGIPEPVYCEREPAAAGAAAPGVRAAPRPGPRPPPPRPDPNAPVETNIRFGDAAPQPG